MMIERQNGQGMTTTKHNPDCKRVFKNYDPDCPRCQELASGAAARPGWSDLRRRNDRIREQGIRDHFAPGGPHERGVCGPICTAFDY